MEGHVLAVCSGASVAAVEVFWEAKGIRYGFVLGASMSCI